MTVPVTIEKYLKQYSVDTRWRIVSGSLCGIDTVVVIPALAESDHIFRTLASLSENPPDELSRTLVVCVINNGDADVVSADAYADNQYTLTILRHLIDGNGERVTNVAQSVFLDRIRQSGLQVAYIDAASPGLEMPGKSAGVGFARKIGMDLSLELFDYDTDSAKLLLCLDADTLVEPHYLSAVRGSFEKKQATTAVIAFAHQEADSADEQAAICCYELFLRYYVLGLRWAGSPYAFHSIGSTMACTARGYVAVRGMNKRRAGEDFYFLDKLAKIGRVARVTDTTVHPSSRPSGRVPFGTGKRIMSFTEEEGNHYSLYDPRSFMVLREWLEYMLSPRDMDHQAILAHAGDMHPSLEIFLRGRRFEEVWPRLVKNSGDEVHLKSHFSRWFDGFETFKLIRHLMNNGLPPIDMFVALRELMEMMGKELPVEIQPDTVPPFQVQMEILEYLRGIDR